MLEYRHIFMGRFSPSLPSHSKAAVVVPVIGLMDPSTLPPVLFNDRATAGLGVLSSSGEDLFFPDVLARLRTDLHFFINSNGGLLEMLNMYRELISFARKGGGKVYSHVPACAGSAAALLALEADQCFTTSSASFMFHSAAPAQIEDRWTVTPCDVSPFGAKLTCETHIIPHAPKPEDRASHDAWVDRIMMKGTTSDRNGAVHMRQQLRQILKDPDNERGEFIVSGGTLSHFVSTVRSFTGSREMRRYVEKNTTFPSNRDSPPAQQLWSSLPNLPR